MKLPNYEYQKTNGFVKDSQGGFYKVRIVKGGNDLQSLNVIKRERTYYDLPKIVVQGETEQGEKVREVTNIDNRGRETLVEIN